MNYAALLLVCFGIGLIVAEFFLPTFGTLGVGGLLAFVFGTLILFDPDSGLAIGLPLAAAATAVAIVVVVGIAWFAVRARRHRVVTGVQGMSGSRAEVVDGFTDKGVVRYGGELWTARSAVPLQAGETVRIARIEGLTVWVERL